MKPLINTTAMPGKLRQGKTSRGRYSWILIAALLCASNTLADSHKHIIGATEMIGIGAQKLQIKARVDTGAQTSSIHAEDVKIDALGNPRGKPISFTVVNQQGQSQRVQTHVAKEIVVKTSEGSERRYAVSLTLSFNNSSKTILVTLNDRAHMRYRLLLGRNWLRGDYIVDVELNDED